VTTIDAHETILHGHRLAYYTAGDFTDDSKPALLLVHGLAGCAATWRPVMRRLSDRYQLVAPDLFGCGASEAPRQDYSLGAHATVLRDLLVTLDLPSATIVGQSLGGGIAMQFAYQYPERCERMILVSSGGLGSEVSWILRALALPGSEYVMPALFPSFVRDAGNAVSRALIRAGVRAPRLSEEWRSYASLTDPAKRGAFVRTLRAVIDLQGQSVSAHDRLYLASRMPTLIVWGARDSIIPVAHAHAAHEAVAGSQLVIFDRAGHFPHVEETERFVDALHAFIATTEPMRHDEPEWRAMLASAPSE